MNIEFPAVSHTRIDFWKEPQFTRKGMWWFTLFFGWTGIHHLYLRSPQTALIFLIANTITLGYPLWYDLIQLSDESIGGLGTEGLNKYGLGHMWGAMGLAQGMWKKEEDSMFSLPGLPGLTAKQVFQNNANKNVNKNTTARNANSAPAAPNTNAAPNANADPAAPNASPNANAAPNADPNSAPAAPNASPNANAARNASPNANTAAAAPNANTAQAAPNANTAQAAPNANASPNASPNANTAAAAPNANTAAAAPNANTAQVAPNANAATNASPNANTAAAAPNANTAPAAPNSNSAPAAPNASRNANTAGANSATNNPSNTNSPPVKKGLGMSLSALGPAELKVQSGGGVESETGAPNPTWFLLYSCFLFISPLAKVVAGDKNDALARFLDLIIVPGGWLFFIFGIFWDYYILLVKPKSLFEGGSTRFFPFTVIGWDADGHSPMLTGKVDKVENPCPPDSFFVTMLKLSDPIIRRFFPELADTVKAAITTAKATKEIVQTQVINKGKNVVKVATEVGTLAASIPTAASSAVADAASVAANPLQKGGGYPQFTSLDFFASGTIAAVILSAFFLNIGRILNAPASLSKNDSPPRPTPF